MEKGSVLITVFTPTYNRAHTLPRLADSLRRQEFRGFEWLVVDDGSTDGTEALLSGLQAQGDLPLRVIRTENGGKHRAINAGVTAAGGAWFFIVDSDDWLPPGALESVARITAEATTSATCCGIIGLRQTPEGAVIGSRLPDSGGFHDTLELHYRLGVRGDKAEVFRTEIMRRYPFPSIEGEKFVTEALVWNRMARDGLRLLVVNKVLYICEYLGDGLTAASFSLRKRNPVGNLMYYSELLLDDLPAISILRPGINFVRFVLHAGKGLVPSIQGLPRRRALAWSCVVPGVMLALADRLRGGRQP